MLKHANRVGVSKIMIGALASMTLIACNTPANDAFTEPVQYIEGPALWTLSDHDTVIHLFGYAPVLRTGTEWQSSSIKAAFDQAHLVVVESDGSSQAAQAAVQAAIPQIGLNTDETLSAQLTEAQRLELNPITTRLGAPLQALDGLKPWLASIQLGMLSISNGTFDLASTPLLQLTADAKSEGKTVRSLERPVDMMKLMSGLDQSEQIAMLMHAARNLRDRPNEQDLLANAWLAGDVETIGQMLHGPNGAWSSDIVYEAVLKKRNEIWAAEIAELLKTETGTIFFSVGFGHFAGQDSLITILALQDLSAVRQ